MKICLLADTHLFSSEIGGSWPQDSFEIFKNKIMPKIVPEKPDLTIFLGDILDPHSGKSDPRWPLGDEVSRQFTDILKKTGLKEIYALKGNHDYLEPLKLISEIGTPKFVDNDWLTVGGTFLYFFTSRYGNLQKAINDLKAIPQKTAKTKILLMHENVSIEGAENIPAEIMEMLSKQFDIIFNGHEHAYKKPYPNVYCLSSTLPWTPNYGNRDIEVTWKHDAVYPKIVHHESSFGFYSYDTTSEKLKYVPIDIGVKLAICKLTFFDNSASEVRERLVSLSKTLSSIGIPSKTIVRVYLSGTLKEGDERIDVGLSELEARYFSFFYEGNSRNIVRVGDLHGGGAFLSKEDLRYVSVEDALVKLETEFPQIREFYKEVSDLIEKKNLDRDALIDRVFKTKLLGDDNAV